MHITRRNAREWAVQMLVWADQNPPNDRDEFFARFWKEFPFLDDECTSEPGEVKPQFKDFAEDRVSGVLDNLEEIDEILTPLLKNWDLWRLGAVERATLRMGIWEMKYTDVPKPVIINEAIDIGNWFAGSKTRNIINAVLDEYAKAN
jgi:N utilization substance protein B